MHVNTSLQVFEFGKLVDEMVEVERFQRAGCGILAHSDGSACVDKQNFGGSFENGNGHNDNFLNLKIAANIRQIPGKPKNKRIFAMPQKRTNDE